MKNNTKSNENYIKYYIPSYTYCFSVEWYSSPNLIHKIKSLYMMTIFILCMILLYFKSIWKFLSKIFGSRGRSIWFIYIYDLFDQSQLFYFFSRSSKKLKKLKNWIEENKYANSRIKSSLKIYNWNFLLFKKNAKLALKK